VILCIFQPNFNIRFGSFIDYLNSEHPGWYLGIRHLTPTNNNSLEATNDVVKNEDTLRKSLLMNQMLVVSKSIVEKLSKARDPLKELQLDIQITERLN
jgi:hypothetical protein